MSSPFRGIHSASLAIQQQLAADLPPLVMHTDYSYITNPLLQEETLGW